MHSGNTSWTCSLSAVSEAEAVHGDDAGACTGSIAATKLEGVQEQCVPRVLRAAGSSVNELLLAGLTAVGCCT